MDWVDCRSRLISVSGKLSSNVSSGIKLSLTAFEGERLVDCSKPTFVEQPQCRSASMCCSPRDHASHGTGAGACTCCIEGNNPRKLAEFELLPQAKAYTDEV